MYLVGSSVPPQAFLHLKKKNLFGKKKKVTFFIYPDCSRSNITLFFGDQLLFLYLDIQLHGDVLLMFIDTVYSHYTTCGLNVDYIQNFSVTQTCEGD